MNTAAVEWVVAIAVVWLAGIGLLYIWSSKPGSWIRRLDGGGVKRGGNIFAVFQGWSAIAGLVAGVLVHEILFGVCAGFVAGALIARPLTRRLHALAAGQGFDMAVPPPQQTAPKIKRTLMLTFVLGVVTVLCTCLWMHYENGAPLRFVMIGGGVGLVFVGGILWLLWYGWRKKNPA